MRRPRLQMCWSLLPMLLAYWLAPAAHSKPPVPVDFNRQIRPILSENCFACHGPDENKRKAKLRLDIRDGALSKRDGYAIVLPGQSSVSELYRRITTNDEDDHMPPAKSGKRLTPEQMDLVRRWIDEGARWEDHWAFIKPERPPLPIVKLQRWPRNDIDSFILARLEQENLKPSVEADKATLIRRVSLDLTGLPPTIAEVEAFLADRTPRGYEQVVERLLQSPRYGEHMARHWLDLARYADSNGYQYDTERSMWRWRDWVIDAFNRNMPFDQFTIEQLAGDLLPHPTLEQKLATAFNRNHPITIEGGVIDEEYRTEYVVDRVSTTAAVWLGLTMGCGRCHDHKYDPITQKDFYRFFAFFNQVPEKGHNGFSPEIKTPTPGQARELASLDQRVAVKQKAFDVAAGSLKPTQHDWEELLSAQGQPDWLVLEPESMTSSGGSTLTRLEDKSILASGENPAQDNYDIVARVDQAGLTAIRLEALTDESLPHKGPGRYENANFILTEFELQAVSLSEPRQTQTVAFASAQADHSQKDYDIGLAIDGKIDSKGWAVDGPTRRENRTAVFVPTQPFGFAGGSELRFRLRHEAQSRHAIGRARLAVSTNQSARLSFELRDILALPAEKRTERQNERLRELYLAEHGTPETRKLKTELTQAREQRNQFEASLPTTMVMQDKTEPRDTFILVRGQYDKPGEKVGPGVPAKLPPLPKGAPSNRLGFARWLVDPSNPLTARVAVNRLWEQLFGTGLVKTSENFGLQGEPPSHPELLDWLASEFMQSGWDMKHIQRLIVTSAAYRQVSRVTPELLKKDPENRLLAHGPRLRMPAEVVRDNALAASGLLVEKVGGPSVYPYQPPGLWKELNDREGYSKEYEHSQGESLYRRSLYSFWKRTVPPPTLNLFDAPEREFCVVRRSRTTTPLQALALLHDPQFVEAARHLAERMMTQGGTKPADRIAFGFRLVTARRPKSAELKVLLQAYEQQRSDYQKDREAALKLLKVGDSHRNESLNHIEHAAWTTVARMILNLDEAITKG